MCFEVGHFSGQLLQGPQNVRTFSIVARYKWTQNNFRTGDCPAIGFPGLGASYRMIGLGVFTEVVFWATEMPPTLKVQ
jgi:hypothetical protein